MKKLSALVIVGLWMLTFCPPSSAAPCQRDEEPAAATGPAFGPAFASPTGQDPTPPKGTAGRDRPSLDRLGEGAFFSGDFASAVRWFSEALEMDSKSVKALSLRARAYLSLGGESNCDKAFTDVARAFALDPGQ